MSPAEAETTNQCRRKTLSSGWNIMTAWILQIRICCTLWSGSYAGYLPTEGEPDHKQLIRSVEENDDASRDLVKAISQRAAERRWEKRSKAYADDLFENVMLRAALPPPPPPPSQQSGAHPREQRPAELTHHTPHDGTPDSHQHLNIILITQQIWAGIAHVYEWESATGTVCVYWGDRQSRGSCIN